MDILELKKQNNQMKSSVNEHNSRLEDREAKIIELDDGKKCPDFRDI